MWRFLKVNVSVVPFKAHKINLKKVYSFIKKSNDIKILDLSIDSVVVSFMDEEIIIKENEIVCEKDKEKILDKLVDLLQKNNLLISQSK